VWRSTRQTHGDQRVKNEGRQPETNEYLAEDKVYILKAKKDRKKDPVPAIRL
jgi:hypothetical protein